MRRSNVVRPSRSPRPILIEGDPDEVRPATRPETMPIALMALVAGFLALSISAAHHYMLLYGDAVSHLGIARGIVDTTTPGLGQLGGVWLPLPHLLMLPFISNMQWWQDGMAGAWPSLVCYVLGVAGMYRLSRRLLAPRWAMVATAFFGLNANLLYLSTTAMTEPLFLALVVWMIVTTLELIDWITREKAKEVTNHLILLGLLILGAVMTRYDGWILGADVWLVVAWNLFRKPDFLRRCLPGFVTFTLLTIAGPISWFAYNHVYGHDWLDFMRGPYSPKEIDRRTSPKGSRHYFGWHDPAWSLMLYARTAQVDAAWWETGWLVSAAALYGTWKAVRDKVNLAWLLLWVPLPFYVYSVSYGSVPIFIPQIYPHSYYNSRYGMELLPVFAIFMTYTITTLVARFGKAQPLAQRLVAPIMILLIVLNLIFMCRAVPLVLKEGMMNSRGRLALEQPMVQQLATFVPNLPILMENSTYIGALQAAGIPIHQTIGPSDYYRWRAAMANPGQTAAYVIAVEGDVISNAVKLHPADLTELSIVCTSDQPCVRFYQSDRFPTTPLSAPPIVTVKPLPK